MLRGVFWLLGRILRGWGIRGLFGSFLIISQNNDVTSNCSLEQQRYKSEVWWIGWFKQFIRKDALLMQDGKWSLMKHKPTGNLQMYEKTMSVRPFAVMETRPTSSTENYHHSVLGKSWAAKGDLTKAADPVPQDVLNDRNEHTSPTQRMWWEISSRTLPRWLRIIHSSFVAHSDPGRTHLSVRNSCSMCAGYLVTTP